MATESFSADWLALREPADHRARAEALVPPLVRWWRARGARGRVVDLGSGTGSNLRWLAPRLGGAQEWTLVDHDADLLARAVASGAGRVQGVVSLTTVPGDLGGTGLDAVEGADLVTASALLDLVSAAWLARLAAACREAGCAALLALSWDGTLDWSSPDPDDGFLLHAVHAHQRRDKGMGRALGPEAGKDAEVMLSSYGLTTTVASSPWELGPADAALVRAMVDGLAAAAAEQLPSEGARVAAWAERRRGALAAEGLGLRVGHLDLLALPR